MVATRRHLIGYFNIHKFQEFRFHCWIVGEIPWSACLISENPIAYLFESYYSIFNWCALQIRRNIRSRTHTHTYMWPGDLLGTHDCRSSTLWLDPSYSWNGTEAVPCLARLCCARRYLWSMSHSECVAHLCQIAAAQSKTLLLHFADANDRLDKIIRHTENARTNELIEYSLLHQRARQIVKLFLLEFSIKQSSKGILCKLLQ